MDSINVYEYVFFLFFILHGINVYVFIYMYIRTEIPFLSTRALLGADPDSNASTRRRGMWQVKFLRRQLATFFFFVPYKITEELTFEIFNQSRMGSTLLRVFLTFHKSLLRSDVIQSIERRADFRKFLCSNARATRGDARVIVRHKI